jgi:oligopeptide transport system substrate-binding protein
MARPFRHAVFALLSIAALLVTACGSTSSGQGLAKDQSLTLVVSVPDYVTLDPAQITAQETYAAAARMFDGLVYQDNTDLAIKPDLIDDLPTVANGGISSDGVTYTFHIKKNVKFSNGDPVTANTFAFSIARALNCKVTCTADYYPTTYLGQIAGTQAYYDANNALKSSNQPSKPESDLVGPGKGVEVADPYTLILRQTKPVVAASLFLQMLSYPTGFAIDDKYAQDDPWSSSFSPNWYEQNPPVTGPFKLDSWTHKVKAVYVPNSSWYGPQVKYLKKITEVFNDDTASQFKSYQNNQLDFSYMDTASVPTAKALPDKQFTQVPQLTIRYVAMNYKDPFFSDPKVRQAFAMAMDITTQQHTVWADRNMPSCHIVPKGMPGYNPNLTCLKYDPTQAKKLLQEAKGSDPSKYGTIKFTYQSGNPDRENNATFLVNEWSQALGVTIVKNGLDRKAYLQAVLGKTAQIFEGGWADDYPDPQDFLSLLWSTPQIATGSNNNNASVAAADTLMAQADTDNDTAKRMTEYNQAEQLLINDGAAVPYEQFNLTYVLKTWVKNFTINAGGYVSPYAWGDVQIASH